MPSQSVLHHHPQAVQVLSGATSLRGSNASGCNPVSAKPCLGFRSSALVSARGLSSRPLEVRNLIFESRLRGKREKMGGGSLVALPATAVPVQSKLSDEDGIVIVDHGSRRAQSNAMLHEFVEMYKEKTGRLNVEAAHMELADPTISDAFDKCVEQGATRIIISPYFLFPGRHWDKDIYVLSPAFETSVARAGVLSKDIPSIAAEAAKKHPNVPYIVTAPIGLHELMVTVINDRMEYCLSQVAGEVSECEMCDGSGRCKQYMSQESCTGYDSLATSGKN